MGRTTEECSMDMENLKNDSAKSQEPERSEFDDPGFRSVWVMPVGLGIFLAVAALVISLA
jgi:hypothetical protein